MKNRWPSLATCFAGAMAVWQPACGDDVRTHVAGQSAHFRLIVADDDDVQAFGGQGVDDILSGLETNWTSTGALLRMPDGVVDYHLLSADRFSALCGDHASGCQLGHSVYASTPVDQHELNHVYMALRSAHQPAALLVEGLADAVGCVDLGKDKSFNQTIDWHTAISTSERGFVYAPGSQFSRYLMLTYGSDRFLAYYEQAPDTHDPQTFAANFAAFWALDLDAVWADMQVAQPIWGPQQVRPICPCSLGEWNASAVPTRISATPAHPYWTWPALGDDTAAWAGYRGSVAIRDCLSRDLDVPQSMELMFARLDGPIYADVSSATVARGRYLSETCADAAFYALPSNLIASSNTGISVGMTTTKNPGFASDLYLGIETPAPATISVEVGVRGNLRVCATCDPLGTDCQQVPEEPETLSVSGRFYLHWEATATLWPYEYTYFRLAAQ